MIKRFIEFLTREYYLLKHKHHPYLKDHSMKEFVNVVTEAMENQYKNSLSIEENIEIIIERDYEVEEICRQNEMEREYQRYLMENNCVAGTQGGLTYDDLFEEEEDEGIPF